MHAVGCKNMGTQIKRVRLGGFLSGLIDFNTYGCVSPAQRDAEFTVLMRPIGALSLGYNLLPLRVMFQPEMVLR